MLIHIIMNYDIKFRDGERRPQNTHTFIQAYPSSTAEVLFRKRREQGCQCWSTFRSARPTLIFFYGLNGLHHAMYMYVYTYRIDPRRPFCDIHMCGLQSLSLGSCYISSLLRIPYLDTGVYLSATTRHDRDSPKMSNGFHVYVTQSLIVLDLTTIRVYLCLGRDLGQR